MVVYFDVYYFEIEEFFEICKLFGDFNCKSFNLYYGINIIDEFMEVVCVNEEFGF